MLRVSVFGQDSLAQIRIHRTNRNNSLGGFFFLYNLFWNQNKGFPGSNGFLTSSAQRRMRPPPLILEEDALCSEHGGENLWQHQRLAERFSNRSANERRPSCAGVITAASLRGELIPCAQLWNCRLWEPRFLHTTHIHWRSGLSVMSDWVKTLLWWLLILWRKQ